MLSFCGSEGGHERQRRQHGGQRRGGGSTAEATHFPAGWLAGWQAATRLIAAAACRLLAGELKPTARRVAAAARSLGRSMVLPPPVAQRWRRLLRPRAAPSRARPSRRPAGEARLPGEPGGAGIGADRGQAAPIGRLARPMLRPRDAGACGAPSACRRAPPACHGLHPPTAGRPWGLARAQPAVMAVGRCWGRRRAAASPPMLPCRPPRLLPTPAKAVAHHVAARPHSSTGLLSSG